MRTTRKQRKQERMKTAKAIQQHLTPRYSISEQLRNPALLHEEYIRDMLQLRLLSELNRLGE